MKNFIHKLQGFGQKAAHLQQVVAGAPAKAAQLRESVLLTAGQLQQMRAEVQGAVTGLSVDNEEWFTQALREISESTEIFREAGYALNGLDMESKSVHLQISGFEHRMRGVWIRSSNVRAPKGRNQHGVSVCGMSGSAGEKGDGR